jgi:hypothetical protein
MTINVKKPKAMAGRKHSASVAARVLSTHKKATGPESVKRVTGAPTERTQLRAADEMLKRIERKSEALSANADKLLRRVS